MPSPSKREAQLASYRRELFGESDYEFYAPSEWHADPDNAMATIFKACCICLALIVLTVVIGVLCAPAKGAELSPSTCRIVEFNADNVMASAYGSGVLVAKANTVGYVLTAQHVADTQPGGKLVAIFPASEKFAYACHDRQDSPNDTDLAVLTIDIPRDIAPRPISMQPLAVGDAVWQSGYGNREEAPAETWSLVLPLREQVGDTIYRYAEPSLLMVSTPARSGDSGGPICDRHGRIVGIISATGEKAGFHVTLADQLWLRDILPENSILVKP